MSARQTTIEIVTNGPGLTEFTGDAANFVANASDGPALLTAFVQHTSCSLLIQENADPDVPLDLAEYFRRIAPDGDDPTMGWMRHVMEGPDDMPAHIRAALTQTSLTVPVNSRRMLLGTWQGLFLFEHRHRPHTRRVVLHLA
ncbi:MAG: secondary thiamine-phosphate synthase enzyme YjbQ [Pseudomonadota bacterium]